MIKDGTLSLPGGIDVPFRLIRPDDVPALQRFHERLSEKTIYLRFFGSLKELPEAKANYFAHVDGVDHLAFVALDPDDPEEIIALVRYDRGPGSERAEYAALVEDRWQGHGVGIGLTRRLVDEARDKGVRYFYAMVMGKNKRMLEADILDRRGELAGNLSLHQEIDFLNEINGLLPYLPKDRYKHIEVRKIEMLRELDAVSKMDRRPSFIRGMFAYGEEQAEEFLEGVS